MNYDHIRKALLMQRKIMTQEELAWELGISRQQLIEFLAGRYKGTCNNRIYQALGIEVEVEVVRTFKLKDNKE